MYGKLTLLAVALLATNGIYADQLTPNEALARMSANVSMSKGTTTNKESLQLAYSSSFKGNNTYYVFNKSNNEGFVILSADDCMPAVLGVVDKGSFSNEKIPANMKWWLKQYDKTISNYIAKGKKYASSVTKKDIAPLLGKIAWGQDEPYNLQCPKHDEYQAVTGCVATAMAQIMRMYKWPESGTGKVSYKRDFAWNYDEETKTVLTDEIVLMQDFSKSKYDWDNMKEEYYWDYENEKATPSFSDTEANAVALLMSDCGIASYMNYNTAMFGGSGSNLQNATSAFVKNFKYDTSAKIEYHNFYTDEDWEDLVYNNLKDGMPIYYTATDAIMGGGHAFICDGYQADGNRFHINWGWDGFYNGYFLMTGTADELPLNPYAGIEKEFEIPDSVEIPVSSFSDMQGIITGLKPTQKPYVAGNEGALELVTLGQYKSGEWSNTIEWFIEKNEFYRGDNYYIYTDNYPMLMASGYVQHEFEFAARFYNDTDSYIVYGNKEVFSPGGGYTGTDFNTSTVTKDGTYKVELVYKDLTAGDTEWKPTRLAIGVVHPEVTIKSKNQTISIAEKPQVTCNGKDVTEGVEYSKGSMKFNINVNFKAMRDFQPYIVYTNFYSITEDMLKKTATCTLPSSKKDDIVNANIEISTRGLKVGYTYAFAFYVNNGIDYIQSDWNMVKFTIVETPTGIEAVVVDNDDNIDGNFDLSGRRVKNLQKGQIYIDKNGKKKVKN